MQIGARFSALPPMKSLQDAVSQSPLAAPSEATNFGKLLVDQVLEVNQLQQTANAGVHEMLTGGKVNQTEVLSAVQKADMSFRLLLQIRNKLVEAYQQLNQMQI